MNNILNMNNWHHSPQSYCTPLRSRRGFTLTNYQSSCSMANPSSLLPQIKTLGLKRKIWSTFGHHAVVMLSQSSPKIVLVVLVISKLSQRVVPKVCPGYLKAVFELSKIFSKLSLCCPSINVGFKIKFWSW